MSLITSRSNPKIKQARLLRQGKERSASGLFLVEGIRHVGEAVAAGAEIDAIYYAPELLSSEFARALVTEQQQRGLNCYAVSSEVFASIADKDNPQGLLAVVRQRRASLAELSPASLPWGVALVAPQDPGNIGAILRSIDAAGASGLILLENSADPYHPSAVRASMGAIFWLPVAAASFDEFADWARRHSYHIYGSSARGQADYRRVAYQTPAILLLGSEREGLSTEQQAICESVLRLPMRGKVSSLNLAVAAGILIYAMQDKMLLAAGR